MRAFPSRVHQETEQAVSPQLTAATTDEDLDEVSIVIDHRAAIASFFGEKAPRLRHIPTIH
jgi:hypothetical protein